MPFNNRTSTLIYIFDEWRAKIEDSLQYYAFFTPKFKVVNESFEIDVKI